MRAFVHASDLEYVCLKEFFGTQTGFFRVPNCNEKGFSRTPFNVHNHVKIIILFYSMPLIHYNYVLLNSNVLSTP